MSRRAIHAGLIALALLASGCGRSHRRDAFEASDVDAGVGDGHAMLDGSTAVVDAGPPTVPDAHTFDGPCPGAAQVRTDVDGPGLSGAIVNLQDNYGVVRFDEGVAEVIDSRFVSKLKNNAYARWSLNTASTGYFYGGRTGSDQELTSPVALVRAPTRIQDITDPRALEYGESTESASLGDIAVFHHEASDSFLALRLEQIAVLEDRPDCATDGGRNPLATGTFSFYLVDGVAGGFAGFGRP